MPGKRTLTGGLAVQRRADGAEASGPDVHAIAAQGTAGAGSALPYADVIQRAFGRHDISGIQAHTGGTAAASARAIGAEAYATGNHVVLGGKRDLHTVAHEAAHVVQQRGGVQLKGGVGEAGDPYEQHADQVADAVVQGHSAEALLDRYAGAGNAGAPATQRIVQRVQVTWAGDIQPVVGSSVSGARPSAPNDPFAFLNAAIADELGLGAKKNALMVKIQAQSEAETDAMVNELRRLNKLQETRNALGAPFEAVLALHAQGFGARDYHAILKPYETVDPPSAGARDLAVQQVDQLAAGPKGHVVTQLLARRTWSVLSPRLGAQFDTVIATVLYERYLQGYERATQAAPLGWQQGALIALQGLDDFALHKLLALLSTTKAAYVPAISLALGGGFEQLVSGRVMQRVDAAGPPGPAAVINGLSDLELRMLARYLLANGRTQSVHTTVGPAAHDAAVGKELSARVQQAIAWEFGDRSNKILPVIATLSSYELTHMLAEMRTVAAHEPHALDTRGAQAAAINNKVAGHHYDSLLKRFADGATPSGGEAGQVNAELGRLHPFELTMVTAKVYQEGKQATLIGKLGDPFKALYHEGLRLVFDRYTDIGVRSALLKERFGIEFGKDAGMSGTGVDWDVRGQAQAWDVLERLPPTHVIGNDKLARMLRYQIGDPGDLLRITELGASGAHGGSTLTVGYDEAIIDRTKNNSATGAEPLANVNRFDTTVRHEVGHAVDAKHNLSAGYCATPAGGDWKKHDDKTALANLFVAQAPSSAVIRTWANPLQKTKILGKLAQILGDESTSAAVDTRLAELKSGGNALSEHELTTVKTDGGVAAIRTAMAKGSPWYAHPTGGIPLADGRIYVQSYGDKRAGDWASYAQAARTRSVSMYQFRAAAEWFAEAYATYYEPGDGSGAHLGRKEAVKQANGALLAARDPATKTWFDLNVATK
ncbi:MAG TPA: DUF4157 domain-containing protein [Kofleriaceae bacterium]|nr:DUF4157 domain-containing protein [Kofleriaceae bacterium]